MAEQCLYTPLASWVCCFGVAHSNPFRIGMVAQVMKK